MTAGSPHVPPGQELPVRRRWWRQIQFLPLILLALLSVVALVVGRVTSAELSSRAAEVADPAPAPVVTSDPVAQTCRPPVTPAAQEPWIDDRSAAEASWQQNAPGEGVHQVVGPNGWIFWSDYVDGYISQAVGRTLLTTLQVEQWTDHLRAIRDELAERGIPLQIIVTPSTSSIYPEELPVWMQELRGSTIMDQFVAEAGDLPIIDLRAELTAAKNGPAHLFSWSNSHWTQYGAYVGWKQIAACVNAMTPDAAPLQVPPITGASVIGDFNEWAPYGVPSPGADWAVPDFAQPLMPVTLTDRSGQVQTVPGEATTDFSILPAETSVASSWTGKSALIFRDSMGGGLSPMWQQAYSPTWQVNEPYITGTIKPSNFADLVDQHHPDVVIVQLAERYLVNPPPQGTGY
jgi:hypothetical protein